MRKDKKMKKRYTTSGSVAPILNEIRYSVVEHFWALKGIIVKTQQASPAKNTIEQEISSIISNYARLLDILEQDTDAAKPKIQRRVRKALGYT